MIRLDPRPGEDLVRYLLRCLVEATETRTSVCCEFEGRVFVVQPGMSADAAVDAYEAAAGRRQSKNQRRAK